MLRDADGQSLKQAVCVEWYASCRQPLS